MLQFGKLSVDALEAHDDVRFLMLKAAQRSLNALAIDTTQRLDLSCNLLLVANRLDRVSGYPNEADEPTLSTAGSGDNPIAWFVMRRVPGNDRDINTYGDFVEDIVKDRIERVDGVGLVNVFGGSEREMRVVIDPARMARYGLTVTDTLNALRAGNAAVSAGDVDEGKRR